MISNLMAPAASAVAGVLVDPCELGAAPTLDLPEKFIVNDNLIDLPLSADEAPRVKVLRGPNIKPIPKGVPTARDLSCEILLKVGDNITTDHIMPAGTKV